MFNIKTAIAAIAALFGIGALFTARPARAAVSADNTSGGVDAAPIRASEVLQPPAGASPVGLRSNNPFNLEYHPSIQWRGQLGTEGRFAVFDTAHNGLRAGMINIRTKFQRDGLNTVRGLISRLSPAFENPTEAYIQYVSQRMGVSPDQPLVYEARIIPLSQAIVTFENGRNPFTLAEYQAAYEATL